MRQFRSFVRKEFLHIFRDRRTMLILLVMPVLLILLFGFAITTEVKNTRVAVLDLSRDEVTQRLTAQLGANRYFDVTRRLGSVGEAEPLFRSGEIDVAVVFGRNFAERLRRTGDAAVQVLADGSEPNQAAVRTGYLTQVLLAQAGALGGGGIHAGVHMLYNPQSKSEYNFVPGVIGMVLLLICAMMTSIAIVREKEQGTMEVLLASPLSPLCIVTAKLMPYFVISCTNLLTIMLLSYFVLGIPVAGSLWGFVGVSLLYILVSLLLGLFISTVVGSQLSAMLLSLLLLVPSMYLSGLAFPIESMPGSLRRVSAVVPTRWYIDAARRLLIQGVDMRYVLDDVLILLLMAAVLLGVSWRMFKTRL